LRIAFYNHRQPVVVLKGTGTKFDAKKHDEEETETISNTAYNNRQKRVVLKGPDTKFNAYKHRQSILALKNTSSKVDTRIDEEQETPVVNSSSTSSSSSVSLLIAMMLPIDYSVTTSNSMEIPGAPLVDTIASQQQTLCIRTDLDCDLERPLSKRKKL
jgi:hypothetical protein